MCCKELGIQPSMCPQSVFVINPDVFVNMSLLTFSTKIQTVIRRTLPIYQFLSNCAIFFLNQRHSINYVLQQLSEFLRNSFSIVIKNSTGDAQEKFHSTKGLFVMAIAPTSYWNSLKILLWHPSLTMRRNLPKTFSVLKF